MLPMVVGERLMLLQERAYLISMSSALIDIITWSIAGVAMSVVASRVIFGLRAEVDKVRRLGQYTLEGKLGEGGMGVVYRASHAMLRRPTAIKILRPEIAGEDALRRFEREVLLTASLSHPSTVAIFDYGRTPQGLFYYAMEYLDGLNLEQLVRDIWPTASGARRAHHAPGLRGARPKRMPSVSSTATSSRRTSSCPSAAACPTSPRSSTSDWSNRSSRP